jgi:hypothetical protein
LNHLKHAKEPGLSLDQAMDGVEQTRVPAIADKRIEAAEERQKIEDILNSMSPTLRIPLVMRDMDELSYEEIAAALGVRLSAVKMRIKRAREQFNPFPASGILSGSAALCQDCGRCARVGGYFKRDSRPSSLTYRISS